MARAQVLVQITDDSYVIPFRSGASSTIAGMVSTPKAHSTAGTLLGLVEVLGNTAERSNGFMLIQSPGEWMDRLVSNEPTGVAGTGPGNNGDWPFYHLEEGATGDFTAGNTFAGGNTLGRFPKGPTGEWAGDWWCVHNYLQYGGGVIVGNSETILKDKSHNIDVVFAGAATAGGGGDISGSAPNGYFATSTKVTEAVNVATDRKDCIAVVPNGGTAAPSTTASRAAGSQASEYVIEVFGQKFHADINRNTNENTDASLINVHCAPDVAGILARTDAVADPWISPAGPRRGVLVDAVRLGHSPTKIEQDMLYDGRVNPIINDPDSGIMLFGDKTTKSETSTLSRINVSRLFIHLKKTIGAAARSKLFEINDADTRTSFKNAIEPFLTQIKSRDGIYDFRVVCDETNNTSNIIDSNQFVADVFIKPAKSINFIQIQFTNKNTQDSLG